MRAITVRPFLVLAVVSLAGCGSDQQFGKSTDVNGAQGPMIQVDPVALDFGSLADGEVATQTFTVFNIGPEESLLDISDIRIGGTNGGFTILSETSFSLFGQAPGQDIEVTFSPEGANLQTGEAIVDSNDEETPHATVDLSGQGRVPELQIEPDPLDMGTTYVGCDKPNEITLTNIGTDTLIISAIDQRGPGSFTFTNLNPLPLNLEPEQSTTVQLLFTPEADQTYASEIVVDSNEPIGTRTATQSGTGVYAGAYSDTFEVPTDPPSDILFFVDQSCSMDDDAQALGDNFSSFITTLSSYTTDWHILVANDDDGCNNSGVLTNGTSNYESRFVTAVGAGGGTWTEAGLTVTSRAVDLTDSGECNDNFLRTSAMLHVILVSDEPEQSMRAWDSYVTDVIAKKGDPALVKFSAVAGPSPSGCSDRDNSAEYGSGYYEAVSYTSGVFLSICDDWGANVEALADASITMSTFTLTHTPAPATIVVSVNSTVASGGWNYDSATNSVIFDPAFVPGEGDQVQVDYSAIANCD